MMVLCGLVLAFVAREGEEDDFGEAALPTRIAKAVYLSVGAFFGGPGAAILPV